MCLSTHELFGVCSVLSSTACLVMQFTDHSCANLTTDMTEFATVVGNFIKRKGGMCWYSMLEAGLYRIHTNVTSPSCSVLLPMVSNATP